MLYTKGNSICLRYALKFLQFELMENRQNKIAAEVESLISSLRKNTDQSLKEQIQSYARRVFSAGPGRPINDSPAQLKERITARVSQLGDQRAVIACQDAAHRFLANSAVYRKQEVLRMLLKLSQLNQQEDSVANIFRETRKRELNITTDTNTTAINNISSLSLSPLAQPRGRGSSADQAKIARNRGSLEENIQESDLVRQLIFVFGNTASTEIIDTGDGYQLRPSLNVSETVKRMVADLSELGWLHKRILKHADKSGTVGKALKLAVTEQLNEYYRWIGSMQTLAKAGRLTLRKLINWSYQPELIIRHLAVIVQAVGPFEGANIISIVNSFRPNGIAPIQALLDRVLSFLIQPLLNYIHNWVYLGELLDSNGQFFISQNKRVSDSEEWTERFELVIENVPNVLDIESAKKIFIAGKTIFFLRNRCKVIYNLKTKFPQTRNSNSLLGNLFGEWLSQTHKEVGAVLIEVLKNQFHLKYHLKSMKDFFLCGKGDFIQHLYDSLREKLSQKKHQISEHSLDGYLSDAIGKCFNDYLLPDKQSYRGAVLDRLLAKKIDYGSGVEGWDCFNLQYSLERLEPMQALLSPQIMMNYQKIFFFLWKIKQIEENLKGIWIVHSKDETIRMRQARGQQVQQLFHSCYILRNSMNHFLTNLLGYLMVSIQSSWNKFWEELDKAPSFDEVLKLHRQFQQQILETTLNTPRGKQISSALNNIFSVITNFKMVSLRLQQSFEEYYEKWRMYEERRAMAQKGLLNNDYLEVPEFASGRLFKDVNELNSCFSTAFKNFFTQLRKEGESKLSVLSFKLDYSEYYSNLYNE